MQRMTFICLILLVFLNFGYGQPPVGPTPDPQHQARQENNSQEKGPGAKMWGDKALNRSQSYKNIRFYSPDLTKRDKEQTFPLAEDALKYQGFLANEGTGLIRIHDISKCTSDARIVNVSEPCPSAGIPGKATAFSFRTGGYEFLRLADVQLSGGILRNTGLNVMVALIAVKDVDLERISLSTPGVNRLADFTPATKLEEINVQIKAFNRGIRYDSFLYRSFLKMEPGVNYAARLIAYKNKVYNQFQGRKYELSLGGKRDDVLVAFRVVRIHNDGSITILWKELMRKPGLIFVDQDGKK